MEIGGQGGRPSISAGRRLRDARNLWGLLKVPRYGGFPTSSKRVKLCDLVNK